MTALTRYYVTEHALANASTIPEVREVVSWYDGIRKAAHATNDRAAEIEAADLHIRATRKLGQMIVAAGKAGALAKGGGDQRSKHRVKKNPVFQPTLASVGVDKNTANEARKLARLDDAEFEQRHAEWHRSVNGGSSGKVSTKLPDAPRDKTEAAAKIRANNVSLKEWDALSPDERREYLQPHNFSTEAQFNTSIHAQCAGQDAGAR
jgi:hypothetical protein